MISVFNKQKDSLCLIYRIESGYDCLVFFASRRAICLYSLSASSPIVPEVEKTTSFYNIAIRFPVVEFFCKTGVTGPNNTEYNNKVNQYIKA